MTVEQEGRLHKRVKSALTDFKGHFWIEGGKLKVTYEHNICKCYLDALLKLDFVNEMRGISKFIYEFSIDPSKI